MRKIMLLSRDPGGANTIFPLIDKLKGKGYEVCLYGKNIALERYKKFGYTGINIIDCMMEISVNCYMEFLKKEKPDFIITGTSADDFSEKFLWKAAEELHIPTFAILDQWTSYGVRFSKYSMDQLGEYEANKCHDYLPTKILVMDEFAKSELMQEGIHGDQVLISGQPYFDYLSERSSTFQEKDIIEFRDHVGCTSEDILITFASEVISYTYGENDLSEHFCGYTERTIFKEILKVLTKILTIEKKKVKLMIRPHPKEKADCYEEFLGATGNDLFTIQKDAVSDAWLLMKASDLILGMSSMFLIEAVFFGKPVMSIQIGLKGKNEFILNERGIVNTILDSKELELRLRDAILHGVLPQGRIELKTGAVDEVIKLMEVYI